MIYLAVVILLLFLLYYYDVKGNETRKGFWYGFTLFTLILISGLRYRVGGDTINYLYNYYHLIPCVWDISSANYDEVSYEPLFYLFNSLVKSLGVPFFVFQLLHALIVNGLIFLYFRRHSNYLFTCVLFYFVWMFPMYNFEEMRASMSLVICLFANDYYIERKWLKGLALFVVASLFHYSAIVLLVITPFSLFLRVNFLGALFLIFSFALGYVIQSKFGDYLMLFDMNDRMAAKASNYANSDFFFEQRMTFRGFLVSIVPYFCYSFVAVLFLRMKTRFADKKDASLIRLQSFLMLGLTFALLSVPMPICYRFARFYIVYFILYFSYLFCGWIRASHEISAPVALLRSLVVFVPIFNLISHIYKDSIRESSKAHPYYAYEKYYPYSSIFEKSISERREQLYNELVSIEISKKPNAEEY